MAKKFAGIRLDESAIDYLNKIALDLGMHHPISKDIPNTTKIINEVITIFIDLDKQGIKLNMLKSNDFIKSIKVN